MSFRPLTGKMFFNNMIKSDKGIIYSFRPLTGKMFFNKEVLKIREAQIKCFRPLTGKMFFNNRLTIKSRKLHPFPSPYGEDVF